MESSLPINTVSSSSLSSISSDEAEPTSTSPSFLDKLPYELYLEILDHISEPPERTYEFVKRNRDVAAFSLVCRATRTSGQQSLHRDVCFRTLASLRHWLRMETHRAVRSIRFGKFHVDSERMWVGQERGELMMDVMRKSPGVQRLIFDSWAGVVDDPPPVDIGVLQLPRLEYLSVTETNLFSAPTSTPSFPSLLYLDWDIYDYHGPSLDKILASSPSLRTLHTTSLPPFTLVPHTLRDLKLRFVLGYIPSEMSRLVNVRRLSLHVVSARQLLEILSVIASKLDYLAIEMIELEEPDPDNTEDCMLACLEVESMKELRKLELRGVNGAFDGESLPALGHECARRGIELRVEDESPYDINI